MAKQAKEKSIEESFKRLEEISQILDRGDKPIDEQLELFAEGVALAEKCRTYLQQAELKVKALSGDDANLS